MLFQITRLAQCHHLHIEGTCLFCIKHYGEGAAVLPDGAGSGSNKGRANTAAVVTSMSEFYLQCSLCSTNAIEGNTRAHLLSKNVGPGTKKAKIPVCDECAKAECAECGVGGIASGKKCDRVPFEESLDILTKCEVQCMSCSAPIPYRKALYTKSNQYSCSTCGTSFCI